MQYYAPYPPCYPYPKRVRKRKTKYYDSPDEEEGLGCPPQPCMYPQYPYYPPPNPHYQSPYHYQYPPHNHINGPVHDTYAEEEKKREEEFAPPDYDHHMYDLPDEHTIESQECDSVPVRSIPDCGSHSCHPEVYGPSRCGCKEDCKEDSNDCNDDTSTICTEESTTQRDTFILRVPKNKKCRIKTDEPHGHMGTHMHMNAYGQMLPHHPNVQYHGHIGPHGHI